MIVKITVLQRLLLRQVSLQGWLEIKISKRVEERKDVVNGECRYRKTKLGIVLILKKSHCVYGKFLFLFSFITGNRTKSYEDAV
jgi:hypothetical protein